MWHFVVEWGCWLLNSGESGCLGAEKEKGREARGGASSGCRTLMGWCGLFLLGQRGELFLLGLRS